MNYGVKCLEKHRQLLSEMQHFIIFQILTVFCIVNKNLYLIKKVDMFTKNSLNLLTINTLIIVRSYSLIIGFIFNYSIHLEVLINQILLST